MAHHDPSHSHRQNRTNARNPRRPRPRGGGGDGKNPAQPDHRPQVDSDPSNKDLVIQNIKSLASSFKDALIQLEPWSSTIEYQRRELRHHYLRLIFGPPEVSNPPNPSPHLVQQYARQALDLLWIDTSYALIKVYRQRLNSVDQEIQPLDSDFQRYGRRNPKFPSDRAENHPPIVGPVARRKLVQRFRSFLRTEDAFWKSLINRLIDHYHIDAARGCLKSLKIFKDSLVIEEPQPNLNRLENSSRNPRELPQDPPTLPPILLVHKALICFGDLIRYGELYARTARNPVIPSTDRTRDQPSKNSLVEPDWSRSLECYNQARLLVPTNGNPSNQLAILSLYLSDVLSSAYHHYRALCVKVPFPTARQNLGMTYSKALAKLSPVHQPRQLDSHSPGPVPCDLDLNGQYPISPFKSRFVTLHAMLFTQSFDLFTDLNVKLCDEFLQYLKQRILSPELILKMTVTCMAAIWHVRTARGREGTQSCQDVFPDPRESTAVHPYTTEVNATIHFLRFSSVLMTVMREELDSIRDSIDLVDLSQNISAVLRRILPAMRILSKWVLAGHFGHIGRIKHRLERVNQTDLQSRLVTAEADFWIQYHQSILLVKQHFPIDKLPSLDESVKLEEDIELIGFLPIESAMKLRFKSTSFDPTAFSTPSEACHPNEEHLMRLGDLQRDSIKIELQNSSRKSMVTRHKSITTLIADISAGPEESRGDRPDSQRASLSHQPWPTDNPTDERTNDGLDNAYDHWMDDDDPVELAMRAVVAQQMDHDPDGLPAIMEHEKNDHVKELDDHAHWHDDVEDEDEIVYLTTTRPSSHQTDLGPADIDQNMRSGHATSSSSKQPQLLDSNQGELSTAADLLASIISKPVSNQSSHYSRPRFDSSPMMQANWTSFSFLEKSSPLASVEYHPTGPTPKHGRRISSISLPKPAEASARINIWSAISTPNSSSPHEANVERIASDWPASTAFLGTRVGY